MEDINNIVFIGAGNVATNLAIAFHQKGKNILQIISNSKENANILAYKVSALATINLLDIKTNADLYIISVKDDAIKSIVFKLVNTNKLIVHTSGSMDINVLQNTSSNYGALYPLQTFSKDVLVDLTNVPFCIEANTIENEKKLLDLALLLSNDVRVINSDERIVIHLAAVFACNFSNYMYLIAENILKQNNISLDILKPLIIQTANKIKNIDPFNTQTGPARRNDLELVKKHLALLNDSPEYQEIYKTITKSIVNKFQNLNGKL